LDESLTSLSEIANVETAIGSEKDLMKRIMNAKERLNPVMVTAPKGRQVKILREEQPDQQTSSPVRAKSIPR